MPPIKSAKGPEVKPLNEMPEIPPHPVVEPPCFLCLLVSAVVLAVLFAWLLPWDSFYGSLSLLIVMVSIGLWVVGVTIYLLDYASRQNKALRHAHAVQRVQDDWQARYLHKAALVHALLVGAAGNCSTAAEMLFGPRRPIQPLAIPEWIATLVCTVTGEDRAERERQLASLLARHWHAQHGETVRLQPLRCYWLGSLESWQAFVAQVVETCPDIWLPPCPEPWQGIDSLYAIIDQLQDAPADARILCAGCQAQGPHGEAALLWLFGSQGRLLFSRGDWSDIDSARASSIAVRVWQPIRQKTNAQVCVSFAEPDLRPLSGRWERKLRKRNPRFDALAGLPDMLAMTHAAWRAEYAQPLSAWGPNPEHRSRVLGIIEPESSSASAQSARAVAL